ncbi:hypothetical protein RMCBS344292_11952 [Rhizopus microsporus]|nr:hypothetical protein RMCBS344292_11952 [Rhizopus microsporus]
MAHRRMDLRFLFSSGSSNDVGDAEFGKKACITKLYYDKEKSMINGKAQLNEIASIYSLDACDIRLCLVQILSFEAVVYEMFSERKGVYALRKAKEFSAPISARRIRNDSEEFFEGLLTRSIAIEPSVIYHGSLKKKGRMSRVAYDNKPASVTRMPPSMATVVLYVE